MSLFSKLFGGKGAPEPQSEDYKGFRITPTPQQASGGFRLSARIEKEIDGTMKSHDLLRADLVQSREEAEAYSIRKAKQVIDEQGDALLR